MTSPRQCEFLLLRFLPDVVGGEAVNFGVVLVEAGWPAKGEAHVRLCAEREWERMERLSPWVEVEVLRGIGEALREDFASGTATREGEMVRGELLRKYEDWFSNNVLLSERRGVLAESPSVEVERLAQMYLEHRVERGERRVSARATILRRLREEFAAWGVLEHPAMRRGMRVSEWSETKKDVRIDFAYPTRDGREFRMVQAVDTASDVEALRLAKLWPRLREGVRAKAQRDAEMTAVVGGRENEFAVEAMEEAGMSVAVVGEAGAIAQRAAAELL